MNLKDAIKSAGSGARGAKFDRKGQVIGGVVESAEIFQSRDDDNVLETWDDGSPKQKLRIIVTTGLDEGADDDGREDDGRRAIYLKWWGDQKKEFLKCMEAAGLDDLEKGAKFFAKYVGDGEKARKSWSAPKNYRFKAVPPPLVPEEDFDDEDEPEESPARPARRRPASKPTRRQPEPEPEPEDEEDFDDEGEDEPAPPPRRRPAKATSKPASKTPHRRPAPQPEPEDDGDEDDLADVDGPVDDTGDALAAAGLDSDF